ncbi:MAG: hypothetical protein ACOCTU_07255 [Bacteroidota bacterium]
MYPKNDKNYTELVITDVTGSKEKGWSITREDGWSFFVPSESPIIPKVGMKARFYGHGIGRPVRGLYISGKKVFYRTEEEQREHEEIELYGKDAKEWLERWDSGKSVFTIEMGGLGPGYEQCIHVTCAELLRYMIDNDIDIKDGISEHLSDKLHSWAMKNNVIDSLGGITGAQYGAALSLAAYIHKNGPRELLKKPELEDRKIQVSKNFPVAV